jgi:hypothetical protein
MDGRFIGDDFKMVAQILVDMDLKEALLEAIDIKFHRWNYTQTLDYVSCCILVHKVPYICPFS